MLKHTKKLLLVILFVIVIMGGSTFVYADVSVETNDSSIITQSVKENKEKADESSTVSYENVNTNQEKIELNETLACDITAKFLQSIYPEYLIDNYLSKKYYDILGKPIGYIIDCYQKDTQCAYVILDSTEKNLICEYSVGENCLDPIQQIMKNNEVYSKEDLFYKVDSLTYAVYDSISNNVYSNSSALDATTSKLILSSASQPATEWDYIMLYRNQVVVDYARSSENHLDDFIAFTENEIESATQHFACAVSALLCCSCYHGIFYGYSDYMDIWNATSTTTYDISSEGIEKMSGAFS